MLFEPRDGQKLFSRGPVSAVFEGRTKEIIEEIDQVDPDLLLAEDSDALSESLYEEYHVVVPRLLHDQRYRDASKEVELGLSGITRPTAGPPTGAEDTLKGVRITIHLPFEGRHPFVFNMRPAIEDTEGPPSVYRIESGELVVVYEMADTEPSRITSSLSSKVETIERYLERVEKEVSSHNLALLKKTREVVADRQDRLRRHRSLEESLSIPLKPKEPPEMHRVPLVRRKSPIAEPSDGSLRRTTDPFLSDEHYKHILSVLSSVSLSMERSPSAFRHLSEEDLRWWFVVALNGHYEGGATGETFNASGKTDILVGWKGKNVFVGECKFWDGPKSLEGAVDQLFDYTTWRDTKTAILVFNTNRNFSRVLSQISEVLEGHEAFKERLQHSDSDTRFTFRLRHPRDSEHELTLTVLAFNVSVQHAEVPPQDQRPSS